MATWHFDWSIGHRDKNITWHSATLARQMILTLEGQNCGCCSMYKGFVALKSVETDKCIMNLIPEPNLCTEYHKINRFLKNASWNIADNYFLFLKFSLCNKISIVRLCGDENVKYLVRFFILQENLSQMNKICLLFKNESRPNWWKTSMNFLTNDDLFPRALYSKPISGVPNTII